MMPFFAVLKRSPDCEAIRPDIAGIMGAFGAALIARERYQDGVETTMLSIDKINSLQFTTNMAKCKGCTNQCRLTINRFTGGRQFVTGNRCERGIGKERTKKRFRICLNIRTSFCLTASRWKQTRLTEARSASHVSSICTKTIRSGLNFSRL